MTDFLLFALLVGQVLQMRYLRNIEQHLDHLGVLTHEISTILEDE